MHNTVTLSYYYNATFTLLYKEHYAPASGQARITFIISIPYKSITHQYMSWNHVYISI